MILSEILQLLIKKSTFLWKRSFVKHVFTLQMGSVFSFGIGFLKSILLARFLGIEGFGIYAVAASFAGTFKVFTGFGQEQAMLTYLAEEYQKSDTSGMKGVIQYFFVVSVIAGLILALFALFSPVLANLFYSDHASQIGWISSIGFLAFAMSLPHPLVVAVQQIVGEVRTMTILENLNQVFQLAFAIIFLYLGYGAAGIFLGLFVSNVLMTIVYSWQFIRLRKKYFLPGIRESLGHSFALRSYVYQGLLIAVDKNVINFFPQALLFIFSFIAPPSTVGIAQLALKIGNLPSGLLFSQAVRMANSELPKIAHEGVKVLRRHCALLVKHTFLFHALLVFGGMMVLPFLVIFAYGWEFAAVISPMLWILLIRLMQPFNVANSSLLRVFRRVQISTLWNSIRIPIELGIFFVLLHYFFLDAPLTAFVLAIFIHQVGAFALNFYVYGSLLGMRLRR